MACSRILVPGKEPDGRNTTAHHHYDANEDGCIKQGSEQTEDLQGLGIDDHRTDDAYTYTNVTDDAGLEALSLYDSHNACPWIIGII